ncbi:glycoside hydrolase family 97 N-terminal domain-containing protein, partial [Chryseobacterium sp.]|uniref:glycoside hydrolase family 97 N-terminal domain-containing protein n=2 Tax=Chryseobacterium TaxID=59732 RepID=UPI00289F6790
MKKYTIGALLFSMMLINVNAQSLQSPDGKFEMNFQLKQGIPYYNLKYNGNVVVEDSKLGLRLFKDTAIKF